MPNNIKIDQIQRLQRQIAGFDGTSKSGEHGGISCPAGLFKQFVDDQLL
jgi:hypothetical protein